MDDDYYVYHLAAAAEEEFYLYNLENQLSDGREEILGLKARVEELEWRITMALHCGRLADVKMDGSSKWILTPNDRELVRRYLTAPLQDLRHEANKHNRRRHANTR